MGAGDELMAMGEAQRIWQATGARVLIVDARGAARWHPVWENHPAIAQNGEAFRTRLVNGRGARPYIKAWASLDGMPAAVYSDWRAQDSLGTLVLTPAEQNLGRELLAKVGPYVVVEPNIEPNASCNKNWGLHRYQEVVDLLRHKVTFVQLGAVAGAQPLLKHATFVRTPTFRDACGVLSQAGAYLGPEGGLHHAAATLRRRAVVIFGGFISPVTTGYTFHENFYVADHHAPCGRWSACDDCARALARIRPADVAHALSVVVERHPSPSGGPTHAR
jgi:ADP-heptose:LPS heptosyltransferase